MASSVSLSAFNDFAFKTDDDLVLQPRMLQDGGEIRGVLHSIDPYEDGYILAKIHRSTITLPKDLLKSLRPLVGKRIGIFHLDRSHYIKELGR